MVHSFPTDGVDYTNHTVTLAFQPGEKQLFVDMTIVDDDILEGVEIFTVTLTTGDSNVDIPSDNDTATITITDDDSKFWKK